MKNRGYETPEKLLIDTYKHIDEARNKMDQFINYIGSQQIFIHHLPDDIRKLVEMTRKLSPEKRRILQLFLESLQAKNKIDDGKNK